MVKNPLSNAGGTGSISDQGAKIPRVTGQLSLHTATSEWPSANVEPTCSGADTPQLERSPHAAVQLRPDIAE